MNPKVERYASSQVRWLKVKLGSFVIAWLIVFAWAGFGLYQPFLKQEWSLSGIFLEIAGILCWFFLAAGFLVDVFERVERIRRLVEATKSAKEE